jgi:ParB/RepB/Spo0J family partition protein
MTTMNHQPQTALVQEFWGWWCFAKEKKAMTTTYAPVLESQDEDIQEVSSVSTVLWRRLGLEALPDHETLLIPTERLVVVGADHLMRSAKRLLKSIQHVGILQPPSVVVQGEVDFHDPDATFEVIAGRRRVLAARLAGLPVVKCEVYAASTLPLSALLVLIENDQRSAAWVREVEALRCLIDEGVGMTLDDLAAFGFDRATLSERLKIAQLPAPLLTRVLAGSVSREVARKLVRLSQVQQARIASVAEAGEEFTVQRVNDLLRAQIGAGLVPLQAALAQGWDASSQAHNTAQVETPSSPFLPPSLRQPPVPAQQDEEQAAASARKEPGHQTCPDTSADSMAALLNALRTFAHSPDYRTTPQGVQTLAQALIQHLHLALRDAPSTSHPVATIQESHTGRKGEDHHV